MCTYELPAWFKFVLSTLFFCYPFLEWWFGRTCKTRAASLIDFVVLQFKKLFRKNDEPTKLLTGHVLTLEEIEDMKTLFTLPIKNFGTVVGKIESGKLRLEVKKDGELDLQASLGYPVAKVLEPVKTNFIDKIKGLIPGTVDDKFLDEAWADAVAKLSEAPAQGFVPQAAGQQVSAQSVGGPGLNGHQQSAPQAEAKAAPAQAAADITSPDAPVLAGANSVQGRHQL